LRRKLVKIHRRAWGELVENVAATNEYHWMAGNFLKYAGPLNWNDLPVDSHELVALCAPRPVFISAGATHGDGWVDAKGMFQAAAGAGPVYRLVGGKDMGTAEFPVIETPLIAGDIAFRQHTGGHTPCPELANVHYVCKPVETLISSGTETHAGRSSQTLETSQRDGLERSAVTAELGASDWFRAVQDTPETWKRVVNP
jgi:hypothetical protein